MQRCAALLAVLMLVLMLWTAGTAQASTQLEAVTVTATAGHFEGDRDEAPADSHKSVPHHHAPCGEHQIAAQSHGATVLEAPADSQPLQVQRQGGLPGLEPGAQLRPPIA